MGIFLTNYSIHVFLTRNTKSDYLTVIQFNKLSCQVILHAKAVVTTRYRMKLRTNKTNDPLLPRISTQESFMCLPTVHSYSCTGLILKWRVRGFFFGRIIPWVGLPARIPVFLPEFPALAMALLPVLTSYQNDWKS